MKPRTKYQKQVVTSNKGLRPIKGAQMQWAFRECLDHYAFQLKHGQTTCMDCGHTWTTEEDADKCVCPKCKAKLEVQRTKRQKAMSSTYFSVLTERKGLQLMRAFQMKAYYRKGQKADIFCWEVARYWMNEKGKVLVDAVSRFVPGVLSNEESSQFESLQDNLLEYPHYTRPETWHEKKVPEVLLSGDHKKIEAWRHEASLVRTAERRPDLLENAFQISCACNEKEESSAWAHDLLAGMTRYGVSLDLGRKKIRKQKNLFDDHDLLILQLPGTLEEGMKAKSEYIRSFAGKETPLVFLCPDGFSEEEEKLEEQLEKNGFRLVARLTGIPSADGLQRFSFALRSLLYSGEWKVKKILASADAL